MPAGELPTLSVLIAAYNEEAVIPAKLENCAGLDYPADKIEFLFGSDGSDDRTEALVRACQAHGVPIVHVLRLYEQITGRVPIERLEADGLVKLP